MTLLIASLITKNELGRYLEPCIRSLQGFCDEIRVIDDHSTDGTFEFLAHQDKVAVAHSEAEFYAHEGRARNELLDWTMRGGPTHVLNIDADEFIADGRVLRQAIESSQIPAVWTIRMQEIWKLDANSLFIRSDGGWRQHDAPILWKAPKPEDMRGAQWRIPDKKLSCGREPHIVRENWRNAIATGTEILHFGWTRQAEREERYQRYVEHDRGEFHASRHLRSIMYPDRRVKLRTRPWPAGLLEFREDLMAKVNG